MVSEQSSNYSKESIEEKPILLHNNLAHTSPDVQVSLTEIKDTLTIFRGSDELIWGDFLVAIGMDNNTNFNSIMVNKFGATTFNNVNISKNSKYYPAIENLDPKYKDSNARKCLAVTLLKIYPLFEKHITTMSDLPFEYDQTHAGELASTATLIPNVDPEVFLLKLKNYGMLNDTSRVITSTMVDVVYENNEDVIDYNNQLVYYLGEQLEQLFNPVTEYSPEQTEYAYKAPDEEPSLFNSDTSLLKSVCNELLQLQTKFTYDLVEFLQEFLIILRVNVLNEEIEGLSTLKLNRLFPPTIDEVTRINCIFLDSLKAAVPFGSFEVLKACNITIPYFYKAYTRHEAATKNFSKDMKLFLENFGDVIPKKEEYTEMKMEALMKGPQEKLLKIKLIIERLWESTPDWGNQEKEATSFYNNIIDIIDSFGKLESPLHSYTTRVFTPSGKILTELAKGWPIELQYKWLKRRVVGVYDIIDSSDISKRKLLVIFSDYVVFLDIQNSESYYKNPNRPMLSDILTNSLINEVPLPSKIPRMKVQKYSYIDDVQVTIVDGNILRFDCIREVDPFSISCRLKSKSTTEKRIADLITKAKILEKDTAFHLFKAEVNGVTLYSTAHEYQAYQSERQKSKVALFLNLSPSPSYITENSLYAGLFMKFEDTTRLDKIMITTVLYDGTKSNYVVRPEQMITFVVRQLSQLLPNCYSSTRSPLATSLLNLQAQLISELVKPKIAASSKSNDSAKLMDMNNFIAEKADKSDKYDAKHEKKRSYGTITTFRSYKSDLKDVESSGEIYSREHNTSTKISKNNVQKISKNVRTKVTESPGRKQRVSKTQADKSKKTSGLSNFFKSIFKGSGKKTKRPTNEKIQLKRIGSNKNISHVHISSKPRNKAVIKDTTNTAELEEPLISRAVTSVEISAEKVDRKDEDERVLSVVHNKQFEETKANSEAPADNERMGQEIHHDAGNTSDLLIKEIADEVVEQKEFLEQLSKNMSIQKENKTVQSQVTQKPTSIKNQASALYLYDNDLFGDFKQKPNDHDNISVSLENELTAEGSENEDEDPKKVSHQYQEETIEYQENEPKNDEPDNRSKEADEQADSKENVELLPTKSEVSPGKSLVFPTIQKVVKKPQQIQRSDSFYELYKGMRMVLDDTDVKYNWKRLPSLVSLSVQNAVNSDKSKHAFEKIAHARETPLLVENLMEKKELPMQATETQVREARKLKDAAVIKPVENNFKPVSDTLKSPFKAYPELTKSTEYVNNDSINIFSELEKAFEVPQAKVSVPTFKVVRTSPTRYVQLESGSIRTDRMVPSPELSQSLSYSSFVEELQNKKPQRLVEIADSITDMQSNLTKDDETIASSNAPSHVSSEFEQQKDISQQSDSSLEEEHYSAKKPLSQEINSSGILESLEFSSFTMGFEDTIDVVNSSHIPSGDLLPETGSRNMVLTRPKRNDAHPVYLLPRYSISTTKSLNQTRERMQYDEDAIWVSPTKLSFSEKDSSIRLVKEGTTPTKTLTHQGNKTKVDIPREESSFGYLSSLLAVDSNNNNILEFV